jgi:hypothetical protein
LCAIFNKAAQHPAILAEYSSLNPVMRGQTVGAWPGPDRVRFAPLERTAENNQLHGNHDFAAISIVIYGAWNASILFKNQYPALCIPFHTDLVHKSSQSPCDSAKKFHSSPDKHTTYQNQYKIIHSEPVAKNGIEFAIYQVGSIVLLQVCMLDKGKSFERMRRKATGLSFQFENRVAGLPGEGGIS